MSHIKKLHELLTTDVLVEVNETIKEIEEYIVQNKKNKNEKEELIYMKEVQKYFNEVIEDIKLNKLTQEQALDILEGLEDMRMDNQEI
mgnify:CR=1 FL=1